ncbi:MAG TPA: PTS fructose transporter subunit IIA [Gammaproteobacteria bacterium]|nr:PTS fructose transporter subunit IIA [Gammaproteobacteria bacterium]
MSVGLLIITHNRLGEDLLNTARSMLESTPLPTRVLAVDQDQAFDRLLEEARRAARELRTGDGLLVLTDAYGSTPSNIANRLREEDGVEVVAGVNLPMLIRIFNYPDQDLERMARTAVEGGRAGVLLCASEERRG